MKGFFMITSEIKFGCYRFIDRWSDASKENAESQIFWYEFFKMLGIDWKIEGDFEKKVYDKYGKVKFIDGFIVGKILIEQKSLNEDLNKATDQAFNYFKMVDESEKPQVVLSCDFHLFHYYSFVTGENYVFELKDLPKYLHLFDYLIDDNSKEQVHQVPVNKNIALSLGKLYNELKNNGFEKESLDDWIGKLLFCMFAEDTGIFNENDFFKIIKNSKKDGSDIGPTLQYLFTLLNTPIEERMDQNYNNFPYVNGKLFDNAYHLIPRLSSKTRDILIKCCSVNWSEITPAIFGNLFESTMESLERHDLGAHYTSKNNILKCADLLFLNDLIKEFEKVKWNKRKLQQYYDKISNLKILDPACGCGNFLIVIFEQLRLIEIEILNIQYPKTSKERGTKFNKSRIKLSNFYGIEYNSSAANIAKISMWLIDHLMNIKLSVECDVPDILRIPLDDVASIICGNSLILDWNDLHEDKSTPVFDYIIGNPPFISCNTQNKHQKNDIEYVFGGSGIKKYKKFDYISCWFKKATEYMKLNTETQTCFISTNTICEATHAKYLWNYILNESQLNINYAIKNLAWDGNAGVTISIINFSKLNKKNKIIEYGNDYIEKVKHINSYLLPFELDKLDSTVNKKLIEQPTGGISLIDGGNFILDEEKRNFYIDKYPELKDFIFEYKNGKTFLNGEKRWVLYLKNIDYDTLLNNNDLKPILSKVKDYRENLKISQRLKDIPYSFQNYWDIKHRYYLAGPGNYSYNYVIYPCDFLEKDIITSTKVWHIDADPGILLYYFAIISSKMFYVWHNNFCSSLVGSAYSFDLEVYNSFYWPKIRTKQMLILSSLVKNIINIRREKYTNLSLSQLYLNDMPEELYNAHKKLDRFVDKLYSPKSFKNDNQRIVKVMEMWNLNELTF